MTTALAAAARQRSDQTRQRATEALQRLHATGQPITFAHVARTAGVSRSWLYRQPDLRADINRLRREILKGEYTGSTLVIEEQGYLADGTPYELTEMPWSQIGDVGVFFLKT